MSKEIILRLLETLTKYQRLNHIEGLPRIDEFNKRNCLNLILTESFKNEPDWLNGFNTPEEGWTLLAISWMPNEPYCLFGSPYGNEADIVEFSLEEIAEYVGLKPIYIEKLFIKLIKDIHHEIITKYSEFFSIELIEIEGFKLPKTLLKYGLSLSLNYPGNISKAGYEESWSTKSVVETLLLAQHEVVKTYLSVNL